MLPERAITEYRNLGLAVMVHRIFHSKDKHRTNDISRDQHSPECSALSLNIVVCVCGERARPAQEPVPGLTNLKSQFFLPSPSQ